MSEQRIDRLRDKMALLRDLVKNAAFDCDAHANLTFPAPAVTAAWINMAKRLRAIVEKTK